jgi:hypothetical protein
LLYVNKKTFLLHHPSGKLAARAKYECGEIYSRIEEPGKAIAEYRKVINDHPGEKEWIEKSCFKLVGLYSREKRYPETLLRFWNYWLNYLKIQTLLLISNFTSAIFTTNKAGKQMPKKYLPI